MQRDDMALVREYAQFGSEEAFTELVSRHINLVYSVALRQVRDPHLAEEVAQVVFTILARKARGLGPKTLLSAWLSWTARYASANALTIQRRRQRREQEAHMQWTATEPASDPWTQIAPLLDTALGKLGEKDHSAVVLRYFEGKSLSEVGLALGTSEDAAKMRVSRALEKLRRFFARRGITLSATAIAGAVSASAVQAAPVTLAKSVSTVALAKGAAATGSILAIMRGTMKLLLWAKMKTAAYITAAAIFAGGTTLAIKTAFAAQPAASAQADPALQGTWVGTEGQLTITGNTMKYQSARAQAWYEAKLTLNLDTDPKQAAALIEKGSFPEYLNKTVNFIYKIERQTLTTASTEPGTEKMPTSFERSPDNPVKVSVLKKQ